MSIPVVGLDPSLRATGLALPEQNLTVHGVERKHGCPLDSRVDRIRSIVGRVGVAIGSGALVIIEAPAIGKHNNGTHELAGLWWAIATRLVEQGNLLAVVNPVHLKMFATGKARADKSAMVDAVREVGGPNLTDHNQADAWWLRQIGLAHVEPGQLHRLAPTPGQLDVLGKVAWPAGVRS